MFSEIYEVARRNLAEFDRVFFIRGGVPQSLQMTQVDRVAYLSIGMNCAQPDVAEFAHFWPRLTPRAVVAIDDCAYCGFDEIYRCFNEIVPKYNLSVLFRPPGQGVILKN